MSPIYRDPAPLIGSNKGVSLSSWIKVPRTCRVRRSTKSSAIDHMFDRIDLTSPGEPMAARAPEGR